MLLHSQFAPTLRFKCNSGILSEEMEVTGIMPLSCGRRKEGEEPVSCERRKEGEEQRLRVPVGGMRKS